MVVTNPKESIQGVALRQIIRVTSKIQVDKNLKIIIKEYKSFCNESIIPGFREIYTSKHTAIRVIWIMLVLFGFALTAFFMYGVCKEYMDEPTATKIKQVYYKEYEFPQIMICLTEWSNKEKYVENNLSQIGITYLYSMIETGIHNFTQMQYNIAKQDFERFAKTENITTYEEAFVFGSWDVETINLEGSLGIDRLDSLKVEKVFVAGIKQVCYNIPFPKQSTAELTQLPYIIWFYKLSDSEINYLLVGTDRRSFTNADLQRIRQGHDYDVKINGRIVKTINKKESSCVETSKDKNVNYNQKECYDLCHANAYEKLHNCRHLSKGDKIFNKSHEYNVCSSFSDDPLVRYWYGDFNKTLMASEVFKKGMRKLLGIIQECTEECSRACENLIFETNLVDNKVIVENERYTYTTLKFKLEHARNGMMIIEETSTYSFQSAVSNIGGQLGLWMGLSIVTVFQVIFYFINKCVNKGQN